jgi:hypothetical protein
MDVVGSVAKGAANGLVSSGYQEVGKILGEQAKHFSYSPAISASGKTSSWNIGFNFGRSGSLPKESWYVIAENDKDEKYLDNLWDGYNAGVTSKAGIDNSKTFWKCAGIATGVTFVCSTVFVLFKAFTKK